MPKTLNVRDLPDELHQVLTARAARRGTSLRQYTIEVLAAHCSVPTMEEWLSEVEAPSRSEFIRKLVRTELEAQDLARRRERGIDAIRTITGRYHLSAPPEELVRAERER